MAAVTTGTAIGLGMMPTGAPSPEVLTVALSLRGFLIAQMILSGLTIVTFWAAYIWGIFLTAWIITIGIICFIHCGPDIYTNTCCMTVRGFLQSAFICHILTLCGLGINTISSIVAVAVTPGHTVEWVFALVNLILVVLCGLVTIGVLVRHGALQSACNNDPTFTAMISADTMGYYGGAPVQAEPVQGQPIQPNDPYYQPNDPYAQQQQHQQGYPNQQQQQHQGYPPAQQPGYPPQQQHQGYPPSQYNNTQNGYPAAQNPGYYQQQQQQQPGTYPPSQSGQQYGQQEYQPQYQQQQPPPRRP